MKMNNKSTEGIFSLVKNLAVFAVVIVCSSTIAYSAVSLPNNFQTGEVISAAEMNANFQALKAAIDATIPVGTIVPFAGTASNLPEGWLLCDGSSQEQDGEFHALFQVIDTSWGAVDSAHFNLPDLRGVFLRGVDGLADRDPDKDARVAIQPSQEFYAGNTGNSVGSYQGDALGSHNHNYIDIYYKTGNHSNKRTGEFDAHDENGWGYDHNKTTALRGGNETRAKNAYVNYIIKY